MMVGSTQQKLGIDIKNSTRIVSGVDLWSIESVRNVSTLSFMVGIIFAVMFLCQLHHVTIYLSDQVTRAFITGSAVHILWSQIPTLFGIRSTQAFTGFLKLYYVGFVFVFSLADQLGSFLLRLNPHRTVTGIEPA